MKTIVRYSLFISLLVGALASAPLRAADPTTKPDHGSSGRAKEEEKVKAKRDWYPFGGIVASVDKQANTISLKKKEGERVLRLDSKSTLEISGKPAALGSVKPGNYAHGKLHKDNAGNEVITDAKFDSSRTHEAPDKEKEKVAEETRKKSMAKDQK